ncbi:glycoside hydrolase family 32 protein [Hymenobacter fodinae]|uniref:Glycoside hydrolase family 32 protein n=1 Tax=Hymenobacter fodinae TaxID=2510796 RepID=A0A4Z0P7F2_9BACT|nr:glycoside hydrolase family 32 protein [Hymenobacter fodinae]TGE08354.1 glycoside hydrolase family 32 protein [Hymenobacter fodinae]
MKKALFLAFSLSSFTALGQSQPKPVPPATPQYRPAYHFTPAAHWMNDPNGIVYYKGTYHLFFQHYPEAMVWGPMHWGHATSTNLVNWQEKPIALFPDSLGYIFSGSAVVDANNTAGFGKNAIVAIFTHHNPKAEKNGQNKFEYQSLAYSTDAGNMWTKYAGNPVLPNPGIRDFRDPKVSWHEASKQWVMTLAAQDRINFYGSPNLKNWTKLSEFGEKVGVHSSVWECPDLYPLTLNGKSYWVLTVNLNNGGRNTQYFIGQFDGKTFTPLSTDTKWLDYGPDNYAGVTWNNTGNRRIFIGWMTNLQYASALPTSPWRSAMTAPRELALRQVGNQLLLASQPVQEVAAAFQAPITLPNVTVSQEVDLTPKLKPVGDKYELKLTTQQLTDFSLVFSNSKGEELVLGYDAQAKQYYIDRTKAGQSSFSDKFASRHTAPRFANTTTADLILLFDAGSVELFADQGLTVMTALFFPTQPLSTLKLRSNGNFVVQKLTYASFTSKL